MNVEKINPYDGEREKGEQVEEMFDSIAPAYDFMNTAMTMGLHRKWRDKALKAGLALIDRTGALNLLDVATGTGDVAFRLHKLCPNSKITGIDISDGMLAIAREKLTKLPPEEAKLLAFGKGDCLDMPFHDATFQFITVAYGVRNFENLLCGLKEMRRVLSPGGVLCVIELSTPIGRLTGPAYRLYSKKIIPFIGKIISGDSRAYSYLPESIAECPQKEEMAELMKEAGFENVVWKSLTFGAVTYYLAK